MYGTLQAVTLILGINVQYYNSGARMTVEEGVFDRDDWTVTVRARNKSLFRPTILQAVGSSNSTIMKPTRTIVFDLNTNWANVTDPRETLNYKFLANPVDVMESRTIVLSEGTGQTQTQPTVTFSLVEGNGSQHNHLFSVDGNGRLKNAEPLDHEANATLSIRIRAVDNLNVSLEKPLVISVVDVPEAPSFASSGVTLSMPENSVASFTFTATDPDANTTLLYSLSGSDAGRFALNVVTGILTLSQPPDFENPNDADANGVYQVTINATDGEANATQSASITISNANDAPVDIHLSGTTVAENQPTGTLVGEFNATDPDANASVVFSFTDGNGSQHNSLFSLDANGTVRTTAILDYEANATLNIRVKVTDDENASLEKAFAITVTNVVEDLDGDGIEDHFDPDDDGDGFSDAVEVAYGSDPRNAASVANQGPSSIDLNGTTVAENQVAGTIVGEFTATDPDANATITLAFADGNGSQHNNLFTIDTNGTLKTAAIFDYETNATALHIRVRATDEHNSSLEKAIAIAVTNLVEDLDGDGIEDHFDPDDDGDGFSDAVEVAYGSDPRNAASVANQAPTTIDLNGSSVAENSNAGSVVGILNATDLDANATITLTFAEGNGSQHNNLFAIDTNGTLRTTATFDYETNATALHIRVKATDEHNASLEKAFAIAVTNVVEDLDGDGIEDHFDPDDDGDGFSDAEEIAYGSDPRNAASVANQAPTTIDLNGSSVAENSNAGSVVGILNATDLDANATITLTFADGNGSQHNNLFSIDGNGTLKTAAIFDYETNATTLNVRVKATDEHNASLAKTFAISLLNVNEPPADLNSTAPLSMAENQPIGTIVGEFNATDPDANPNLTFTLVEGSNDNHLFAIDANGTLRTVAVFDYETNATFTIRAKVRDQYNAWIKENFTITITNVVEDLDGDSIEDHFDPDDDGDGFSDAEEIDYGSDPRNAASVANQAPTLLDLNGTTVPENQVAGTIVGEFNATDPDANATIVFAFIHGLGDEHNHLFAIDANGTLRTAAVLDHEANASWLEIRVRAIDEHNASLEKGFAIHISDDDQEDADGDGLKEFEEDELGTSDLNDDSDGDGSKDNEEIVIGSDPDSNVSRPVTLSGTVTYDGDHNGTVHVLAMEGFEGMVTIEMIDSYGDGWNGNELTIVDDGNNTLYSTTLPSGHQGSEMIELIGGRTYTVNVGGGQFMSEVSWEIRAVGEILASGEASTTAATLVTPGSAKEVVLPQFGNYQMTLASDQAYEVFAFLDVDGNHRHDPLEPAGFHSAEPIFVAGNLSEINIDMIDNAAPTDLALSADPVTENQPQGSIVGLFSVTDPDDANGSGNYSFYLASGEGSEHNARFTIEGNQLKVVSPDYESGSIHSIRVRAKDAHGATIEKTFSIVVTDDPSDNPIKVFDSIVSAPDTVANDNFGNSISQSGDLLAVGAPDASIDDQPEVGAAYLFRMEANGSTTYLTKVSSPDGAKEDKFGTSVSLSGNLLIVGTPGTDKLDENDTGAVYLYRVEHNGTASHLAKLTVPDGSSGDRFGDSITFTGSTLAVGASGVDIVDKWDVGAVYLYRVESNGTSSHLAKLTAPDGSPGDRFGGSITLTGNMLAVGASGVDADGKENAGAVYLYRKESNGSATYMSKLTAPDGSEGDYFGYTVDIGVDLLAVGAPWTDIDGKENAGAVYLYRKESNGSATYMSKLTAPDSSLSDYFGRSISLSGDLIAVAVNNETYLFRVSPDDSASSLGKIYDHPANVVSLSGLRLVTGRSWTNTGGEANVIDLSSLNNTAPSDLHISNSSVTENEANDTVVGNLHAIDADDQNGSGDHFYEFVDGNGSEHNILFRIDENGTLRTKATFDHEVNATLSIRVRTTDEYDASFEKIFTINVTNVVEDLDGDGIENHADPDDDGDGFTDTEEIEGGSNPDDNASFLVTVSGTLTYMGNSTGKVHVMVTEGQAGVIEIEMIDSYGDGWNGAELTISDDANVTVYVGTFETGARSKGHNRSHGRENLLRQCIGWRIS